MYKGHVLVSAPRKAALAKDAMLTKFPGCLAHFIKTEKKKKEKRLWIIPSLLPSNCTVKNLKNATMFQELKSTDTSQTCEVISEMDHRSCVRSDATVFDTMPVAASATSLAEKVFENAGTVLLLQQHGFVTGFTLTV